MAVRDGQDPAGPAGAGPLRDERAALLDERRHPEPARELQERLHVLLREAHDAAVGVVQDGAQHGLARAADPQLGNVGLAVARDIVEHGREHGARRPQERPVRGEARAAVA